MYLNANGLGFQWTGQLSDDGDDGVGGVVDMVKAVV